MIVRYAPWNKDIEVEYGRISSFVIESPGLLDRYICDLGNALKGKQQIVSLIEENKVQDISKRIDVIYSPNDITYNTYSFKKKLYQSLVTESGDELWTITGELQKIYYPAVERVLNNSYYDLNCEFEINEFDLLDLFKVTLKTPEGRFQERLTDYVKTVSLLMGRDIFVLVNCSCYFDGEGFDFLKRRIADEEVAVLMVDHHQTKWLSDNSKQYIIDIDDCEITNSKWHMESQCSSGIYSEIVV